MISLVKAMRSDVLSYLSGNPSRSGRVRLTRDGLPTHLGPLVNKLRDGSLLSKRFVLTVLFATRALRAGKTPDTNPITDPLDKGASIIETVYAADFWRELGYHHPGRIPRSLKFKRFHFTTKTGPNGHALSHWYEDLLNLPKQLVESISVLGGEVVRKFMDVALRQPAILEPICPLKGTSRFRKLSHFPDREDKVRIIAIGDYFSQTVLRPLHLYLFRVLKKIPQDCTFDQGAFQEKLKGCEIYYSIDLTAATDRFPIQVISQVLRAHLPP